MLEITPTVLITTHILSFVLGAFAMHITYKKNTGKDINFFKSLLSLVIIFFWSASLYKEIFLGGGQTPYILYVLFGLVQGAFFEFNMKDVIAAIKKK